MTPSPSPDLSVIVPTLDAAATVRGTLESIASSAARVTPLEVEIIVVDGGSLDGTRDVVTGHPGVRLVRQRGRGLASARNEGILTSRAPIVGFCDADDRWTPDALANRLEEWGSDMGRTTGNAWVTGWVHFVALDAHLGSGVREPGTRHPGFTPGATLIHRDALDRVGPFDTSLRIGADADWMMRAVTTLGQPCMTREIVLKKGLRPGSLSTDVDAYRKEMMIVARRFLHRERGKASP